MLLPPALQGLAPDALANWARGAGFGAINAEVTFDTTMVAALAAAGLRLGPLRIKASLADSDRATRARAAEDFCAGIDRAVALGLDTVWTLPRNFRNDATPRANFAALRETLPPVVVHAERSGVRIAIENCPFEGENVICTPEAWDALFTLLPSPNLGLCLDPSHCVWLGIDYLRVVRDYAPRLYHVHAKDAELLPEGQFRYGTLGPQLTDLGLEDIWPRHGWWRYRLAGYGTVNWNGLIAALADVGYAGMLAVEHEDPLWGGSPERVRRGLALAHDYLRQFVP